MNDKSTENKINRIQKEIEDMERPDYGDQIPASKYFVEKEVYKML